MRKKVLVLILSFLFLFNALFPLNKVYAENNANARGSAMINFFRQNQTQIDLTGVSDSELLVYGVFISNFMIPGRTMIKDLVDMDGDESIPKRLSLKFFGSEGNAEEVRKLNEKLYNAIKRGFETDLNYYGLYKEPKNQRSSVTLPMSGLDLLDKLASPKDADGKIYNSRGDAVLDFQGSNRAAKGAMQILFGVMPDFVLGPDGIKSFNHLYMDGLGNIWGSYVYEGRTVTLDEYVLVFPAALNPAVFDDRLESQRLPLNNVFAMGAIVKITDRNFLERGPFVFPYYNLKEALPTSTSAGSAATMNRENFMSIFGVESASGSFKVGSSSYATLGNLNGVLFHAHDMTSNPFADGNIQDFINRYEGTSFSEKNAMIFISFDASKFPDLDKYFLQNKGNRETLVFPEQDKRSRLFTYLFNSTAFQLSQIADMMYYFDLSGMGSSYKGASGGKGSWFNSDSIESLIIKQRMFAMEDKSPTGTSYRLYDNSYVSSPFNTFLRGFSDALNYGTSYSYLRDWLQDRNNKKFSSASDSNFDNYMRETSIWSLPDDLKYLKALHNLLATGSFGFDKETDGISKGDPQKVIVGALELLNPNSGRNLVMDVLPPATLSIKSVLRSAWYDPLVEAIRNLFGYTGIAGDDMSWGLTEYDNIISMMSLNILDDSKFSITPINGNFFTGFKDDNGGGSFVGVDVEYTYESSGETKKVTKKSATRTIENSISTLLSTALAYRFFSVNSYFINNMEPDMSGGVTSLIPGSSVESRIDPNIKFAVETAVLNGVNNYPGIFWGYMVDLLNIDEDAITNNGYVRWKNNLLIAMPIESTSAGFNIGDALNSTGLVASEERTLEEMQEDIIKKVYGLLSDGPNSYRDKLIKSTQDSWIISTHRSITGSWMGNPLSVSAGGNNSYASVVGYINTPSLSEIPLTAWLLEDYLYVYMFFFLLVLVMVVLMVIAHVRSVREGVLILIMMAFVLLLPQFLVSSVINLSNSAGDRIYASRFNYWAITQHEQSYRTMLSAMSSGNELNYVIASNVQNLRNVYNTDVGVRVKWMAPKREDYFEDLFTSKSQGDVLSSSLTIFRWLFNSYFTQQEYVFDNPFATYLYRPYNAIASEAAASYERLSKYGTDIVNLQQVSSMILSNQSPGVNVPDYRFSLFHKPEGFIPYSDDQKRLIEMASVYPTPASGNYDDKFNRYRFWPLLNRDVAKAIFNDQFVVDPTVSGLRGDTSNDFYQAYVLMTESPFYYFYNVFKMRYGSELLGTDFRNSLLEEEVFKVKNTGDPSVDGKLRDFLDLEGLFTYVIPYLQQGNEYVYQWTSKYGMDVESFDFSSVTDRSNLRLSEDFEYQEKKKETLKNVWKLYAPWVDQIYDLGVTTQSIPFLNSKVLIEDTLNPAAYQLVGRPMIFSEADMAAKRYNFSQLTDIERRIQATLRSTYKDLMYLVNYRDFSDDVLITAAAMIATFNFNREFSEYRLLGESTILYPQNFELKNFNYDAFMRLLLLNSTGEPIMADKDLYVRVLENTSFFTGILLLLCDILAVYAIPAFKILALFLMLLLSFVIVLSCIIQPPNKIVSVVLKNLGLPALLFLIASISFAFVIALFMGEGVTAYVGGRLPSLGMTDPTVTMGLMVVVDLVYLYVLWRIVKMLLSSFKAHLATTILSTVALMATVGSNMVNRAMRFGQNFLGKAGSGLAKGAVGLGGAAIASSRHKELVSAINKQGDSSGGSSDSADRGSQATSNQVKGSGSGAKEKPNTFGQKEIDELASKPAYSTDSSNAGTNNGTTIQRKRLGHRVVDFGFGLKRAGRSMSDVPYQVKDSINSGGQYVKDVSKYAVSGDGLRRDVALSFKSKANSYIKDMQAYRASKLREDIEKMDAELKSDKLSQRTRERLEVRRARDLETYNKVDLSVKARDFRSRVLARDMEKGGFNNFRKAHNSQGSSSTPTQAKVYQFPSSRRATGGSQSKSRGTER